MTNPIESIQEAVKDVPAWVWWVGGGVVLVVFVVLSRKSGAGTYIPASSEGGTGQPTAQPMPNQSGIEDALLGLASYFDSATAALRADNRQLTTTLASINQNVASVLSAQQMQEKPAAVESSSTASPREVAPASMTLAELVTTSQPITDATLVSLPGWVDSDTNAGYITVEVKLDNEYERGILGAKSKYYAAEAAGDTSGMTAARAEADRYREAAKQAGVELDRELQDGDKLYPDQEPKTPATSTTTPTGARAV